MVIVKPFKPYMFYGIFITLCYALISMLICIFEVCWQITYGESFYFSGTVQLILGASRVSGFCMVWVSNVKNILADYCFCCFIINKLSCYVIFRKVSCTMDLLVLYLDAG